MSVPARRLPKPPSRRRSRVLSRDAVVDAAIRVLDTEGLDAVTMRGVAEQLGTGPASLYAHVRDKDDLVGAVVDRIAAEVELPAAPDPDRWQEQIKGVLRSIRVVYARHRDVARASLGNIPTGEAVTPVIDRMLGILLAGGLEPQVAAWSTDLLVLFVSAVAFEQSLPVPDLSDWTPGDLAHTGQSDQVLGSWFASLPADRFPHLVAMAGPMTSGDGDERFEFGLDLIVRGIASGAPGAGR